MSAYDRVRGIGKYTAQREAQSGLITLRATGVLYCSNHFAALEKQPLRVIPPQWDMVFYVTDFCKRAFKPFELVVPMLDTSDGASHVIVRDVTGEVNVPVVDEAPSEPLAGRQTGAGQFRVYALLPRPDMGHHGCIIIPDEAIMPAIYYSAFGPASYEECRTWIPDNCSEEIAQASGEIPWPLAE